MQGVLDVDMLKYARIISEKFPCEVYIPFNASAEDDIQCAYFVYSKIFNWALRTIAPTYLSYS